MDDTIRIKYDEQDSRINVHIYEIAIIKENHDKLKIEVSFSEKQKQYAITNKDNQISRLTKRINILEADRLRYERWLRNLTILLIIALIMPFVMLSFFI